MEWPLWFFVGLAAANVLAYSTLGVMRVYVAYSNRRLRRLERQRVDLMAQNAVLTAELIAMEAAQEE